MVKCLNFDCFSLFKAFWFWYVDCSENETGGEWGLWAFYEMFVMYGKCSGNVATILSVMMSFNMSSGRRDDSTGLNKESKYILLCFKEAYGHNRFLYPICFFFYKLLLGLSYTESTLNVVKIKSMKTEFVKSPCIDSRQAEVPLNSIWFYVSILHALIRLIYVLCFIVRSHVLPGYLFNNLHVIGCWQISTLHYVFLM